MNFFLTRRGGQKLRYFTAAAISTLILLLLAAVTWYVLIYTRREVSYVEVSFTGSSIPLSEGLSEQIEKLRGMTLKEASSGQVADQMSRYDEITAAAVKTDHRGEAAVRLTAVVPIALLQLEEEDFYRSEGPEGNDRLVTDVAVLENGKVIPSYAELTEQLLRSVPTVGVSSRQRSVSEKHRVDGQLRAFISMLNELREQGDHSYYERLSQLFYDRHGARGIECTLTEPDDKDNAMKCIVPRPMSGAELASALQAAERTAQGEQESTSLTVALLSDYTVLSGRETSAE